MTSTRRETRGECVNDAPDRYDVAVVGAGVAGLGVAWRLAQRGWSVGVIDAGKSGQSSRAAAGMLAPTSEVHFGEDALLRLQQFSLERFGDFVAELVATTGVDVDYLDDGALCVGLDRDDTEALDRIWAYQRRLGLDARRLTAAEARDLEPHLSPNVHSAVLCPGDHQVDAWKLTDALTEAVAHEGGRMIEATVTAIRIRDGRADGLTLADGSFVGADRVLAAAGAWSSTIDGIPELRAPNVRPVRGHALTLLDGQPRLCKHVIRAPDAYLAPKSDGSIVVGATSEEVGFDERLTAGGTLDLLRGAWEAMPGVYDLAIGDQWCGFRPMSLDNAPLLGPSRLDGLWLACGHGRHGILLSAATAELVSQAIAEERLPELCQPLSPRRFGG